jgi:hypothetical protein
MIYRLRGDLENISKEEKMIYVDFLFSLIVSLILTSIFVLILRRKGFRSNYFFFFAIILLASWAGGIWLQPVGPRLWGAYLLSFLIVGLIFALLLGASILPRSRRSTVELVKDEQKAMEKEVLTVLGGFFWILLIFLAGSIVVRYLWVHGL